MPESSFRCLNISRKCIPFDILFNQAIMCCFPNNVTHMYMSLNKRNVVKSDFKKWLWLVLLILPHEVCTWTGRTKYLRKRTQAERFKESFCDLIFTAN